MKYETVSIRNERGKELCEISATPLWMKLLNMQKAWDSPEGVIEWAWHQTFLIALLFHKFQIHSFPSPNSFYDLIEALKRPPRSYIPCEACGKASVFPVGLFEWVLGFKWITGFKCHNKECSMKGVVLPFTLLNHMYEMPLEIQRELGYMIVKTGESDRMHWGNYTVLKVEGQWSDINDAIVKGAREGNADAISLLELLSKGDS